ncbi:MAG: YerC/YecD family TrpR-related protein [Wenzhouxiangella sp.]|jgi:TrpR-related protein YerC/YecD|nr:YerC/YecD family TrpR-related protein [Wenzhouxiangella sp.]
MKQLDQQHAEANRAARSSLAEAFLAMTSADECRALLKDLTTPAELEALVDRWRVVKFVDQGMPYRQIHELTGVSVTTIGRVARFLENGNGGYRLALERLKQQPE